VWRRARARIRALEQERALERERARIARDMHDELGTNLTQITITTQLAKLEIPEAVRTHIETIEAIARRTVTTLDEIVWTVNPRNDTLAGLLGYLGQHAVEFLGTAGLDCELDLPQESPEYALPAHTRHSLYLAVKEAINNVVKHAEATCVWIKAD